MAGEAGPRGRGDVTATKFKLYTEKMTFLSKTQELEARSWECEALFLMWLAFPAGQLLLLCTGNMGSLQMWAGELSTEDLLSQARIHSIYYASSPSTYSSPSIYPMGEKQMTNAGLTQWFLSSLWEAKGGDMTCWYLIIPSFLLSPPLQKKKKKFVLSNHVYYHSFNMD